MRIVGFWLILRDCDRFFLLRLKILMTLLDELIERRVIAPLIEERVLSSEARRRLKLGKGSKCRKFENKNEKLASVKIRNAKSFTVSVF